MNEYIAWTFAYGLSVLTLFIRAEGAVNCLELQNETSHNLESW